MRRAMKNSKFTNLFMQLLMFKNTVFILLFTFFSCGTSVTEKEPVKQSALDQYIEAGADIKEDSERDLKRKRKRAKNNKKYKIEVGSLKTEDGIVKEKSIEVGADQFSLYSELLQNKSVGVVANQTSRVENNSKHLVDFLVEKNINLKKVFAPEHGFRGKADAGEVVKDGVDTKTGLPIISLYGKNKKPSTEQLDGIDIMVFDIQDVGARF